MVVEEFWFDHFAGFRSSAISLDKINVFVGDGKVEPSAVIGFLHCLRQASYHLRRNLSFLSQAENVQVALASGLESQIFQPMFCGGARILGESFAFDFERSRPLGSRFMVTCEGDPFDVLWSLASSLSISTMPYLSIIPTKEGVSPSFSKGVVILPAIRNDQRDLAFEIHYPEHRLPPWKIEGVGENIAAWEADLSEQFGKQIFVTTAHPTVLSSLYEQGAKCFLCCKNKDGYNEIFDLSLLDFSPAMERGARFGDLWATMPTDLLIRSFDLDPFV